MRLCTLDGASSFLCVPSKNQKKEGRKKESKDSSSGIYAWYGGSVRGLLGFWIFALGQRMETKNGDKNNIRGKGDIFSQS